jgi:hypothetical protein
VRALALGVSGIPQGLSKELVLRYLLQRESVLPGRVLAMGDQPAGNGMNGSHAAPLVRARPSCAPPLFTPSVHPLQFPPICTAGNDIGLTKWHTCPEGDGGGGGGAADGVGVVAAEGAVPFVSVAERASMVPSHLGAWHVTAGGGNVAASAAALAELAVMEAAAQAAGDDGACVDLAATREMVSRVNAEGPSGEAA